MPEPTPTQASTCPVFLQLLLRCSEQSFIHQRRNGHEYPFLGINRHWRVASPWFRWPPARRPRSRLPRPRHHSGFAVGRPPNIRRVLKNVPYRLSGPDTPSGCGQCACLLQPTTDFVQTTAIAPDPGEDLPNHMFLFRIRLKLGLAASFPDRYVPVSEWSTRHDIQGAVLCRMALTTPTALHELGALIFSNDALHLEQQVVFRTLAQRPVQEDQL